MLPAAAGLAWLLIVAAMAEAGFSGEPRYALPGAALLAVTAGAGLAWVAERHRAAPAVVAALVAGTAAVAAAGVPGGAARLGPFVLTPGREPDFVTLTLADDPPPDDAPPDHPPPDDAGGTDGGTAAGRPRPEVAA